MHWTEQKPSTPGEYWYRTRSNTAPQDFEILKVTWDAGGGSLVAETHGRGSIAVDLCGGEWCGPIAPPAGGNEACFDADRGRNARIAVRLMHGGSFYVDNTIPDDVAVALSEKLKALRSRGISIPSDLRARITGLLQELIRFAGAPPAPGRTIQAGR